MNLNELLDGTWLVIKFKYYLNNISIWSMQPLFKITIWGENMENFSQIFG